MLLSYICSGGYYLDQWNMLFNTRTFSFYPLLTHLAQCEGSTLEIRILMCIVMYSIWFVSDMYRECVLCVMYLKYRVQCILIVS